MYTKNTVKRSELFLPCDCYSEGLLIQCEYDPNYALEHPAPEFQLAMFHRGLCPVVRGWRDRLRWCWQILVHGEPFTDEICMNAETAQKFARFIQDCCIETSKTNNTVAPESVK